MHAPGTNVTNVLVLFCICFCFSRCGESEASLAHDLSVIKDIQITPSIITGAARPGVYTPMLEDRNVAVVANQTARLGNSHLVDTLLKLDVKVRKVFSPEHGIRGTAERGKKVSDSSDPVTGLPVVSLYGSKRKPAPEDLSGIDVVVFDLQDVGARFYTYISTMHYVMEACAEQGVELIVLDRPNPNGYYIDGPVRTPEFQSFVAMHPIPIVHGLTVGELARMINGEGWLANGVQCSLSVIACKGYDHTMTYDLPIAPSPNLPNLRAVLLYPSLCLFEGTTVSVGRGTNNQFQVLGHPAYRNGSYSFTPRSLPSESQPKWEGEQLYGVSLKSLSPAEIRETAQLDLHWLLTFYEDLKAQDEEFFLENGFFDKLAGTNQLRQQIISGMGEKEIRSSWQKDLEKFKGKREKYLLYPDFDVTNGK